jgi:hypothetical protein
MDLVNVSTGKIHFTTSGTFNLSTREIFGSNPTDYSDPTITIIYDGLDQERVFLHPVFADGDSSWFFLVSCTVLFENFGIYYTFYSNENESNSDMVSLFTLGYNVSFSLIEVCFITREADILTYNPIFILRVFNLILNLTRCNFSDFSIDNTAIILQLGPASVNIESCVFGYVCVGTFACLSFIFFFYIF